MITIHSIHTLPDNYKKDIKHLNESLTKKTYDQYSNILVINENGSMDVYGEWKYFVNYDSNSITPISLADCVIKNSSVIKNRYGHETYKLKSDKELIKIRTGNNYFFKIQAKCIDNIDGFGDEYSELSIGSVYNVTNISMGQSFTFIHIYETDKSYNSTLFEFYKDGKRFDIFNDKNINPYL